MANERRQEKQNHLYSSSVVHKSNKVIHLSRLVGHEWEDRILMCYRSMESLLGKVQIVLVCRVLSRDLNMKSIHISSPNLVPRTRCSGQFW
jgi:hypothetical protein